MLTFYILSLDQRPPLNNSAQLLCGHDKLQIGLDSFAMSASGWNPFSGNLAVHNCSSFIVLSNVVWYEVEAQAGSCGNTLTVNMLNIVSSLPNLYVRMSTKTLFCSVPSLDAWCKLGLGASGLSSSRTLDKTTGLMWKQSVWFTAKVDSSSSFTPF